MSFRIIGTGSQKPACVKTNEDLTQFLDTSDEWITTRTGIKERRIITTETLSELATKAAEHALEMAGVKAEDLDFIICSTIRGDYITPSPRPPGYARRGPARSTRRHSPWHR